MLDFELFVCCTVSLLLYFVILLCRLYHLDKFGWYFRFELHMLLESVSLTSKPAKELLNSTNNNTIGLDGPIRDTDYFTGL